MSANISIFVPHLGCRYKCSFCNQFSITEEISAPDEHAVKSIIERGVSTLGNKSGDAEIAFFGGSFTAIDLGYMLSLLKVAYPYVKDHKVKGIRISTRPDEIDDQRLGILKEYGVTSIELGAQSMDDDVLEANNRGHCSLDVINASNLIRQYGFELGLQMMTGLYKSNDQRDIYTAEELIKLRPDTARIYPTVLLKNTYLYRLYLKSEYRPQTLENAVSLCCDILKMFYENRINVIRVGLHSIDETQFIAGPWHPAFGELCKSRMFRNEMEKAVSNNCTVFCNRSDLSKIIGQKKCNIQYFKNKGIHIQVVEDGCIDKGCFKIKEANGS